MAHRQAFSAKFQTGIASTNTRLDVGQLSGLFRSKRPRTGQHVRRNSYHIGERETRAWVQHNTFGSDEHNARMCAAEKLERETKAPGKRNGALGYVALDLLRFLLRLRNRRTGQLDPSYAYLAKELNRSRSAIVAAAHRLKQHGFLDWIRRTQLVEDADSDQYVQQVPNAFLLTLPRKAVELVGRIMRRPTEQQQRKTDEAARRQRLNQVPSVEEITAIADPELRELNLRALALVESASPPSGHNDTL
ncbi:helix-turn-helix domain-containing protein [Sphingomonas sp. IC-56]|uniref:helix-turn-helix domain-containing protein n=1 Tax=Sphingomonas sp. IC-56 TaxID=2898529 RepID=UPI001E3F41EC|nr:helix-turn-helix domain-containing protein [Sphingomonas sp. IC-56]MCD2325305.1 helix-turn-helix domain-containing protein [Sphingomonas sp. IC-56]